MHFDVYLYVVHPSSFENTIFMHIIVIATVVGINQCLLFTDIKRADHVVVIFVVFVIFNSKRKLLEKAVRVDQFLPTLNLLFSI